MKSVLLMMLLISTSLLLAQADQSEGKKTTSKGQITVRGCVSKINGDYVLLKQSPAVTYQLQGTKSIRLQSYLGKRVEVTGAESSTLATSSDALTRSGSASPVTITVNSINTVSEECPTH